MFRRVFTDKDAMRIIGEFTQFLGKMKPDKKYRFEVVEHKEKRSLDANAYFWVLCDKLAEKTHVSKTNIYRNLIKEIGGVSETYCGKPEPIKRLCSAWESNGIGWMHETSESKIDGCMNATLYYGSSTYDTAQMSRLIDLIIQECQQQKIETKTPEELERLLMEWGE